MFYDFYIELSILTGLVYLFACFLLKIILTLEFFPLLFFLSKFVSKNPPPPPPPPKKKSILTISVDNFSLKQKGIVNDTVITIFRKLENLFYFIFLLFFHSWFCMESLFPFLMLYDVYIESSIFKTKDYNSVKEGRGGAEQDSRETPGGGHFHCIRFVQRERPPFLP